MTDERQDLEVQETEENDVSRRDFIAMSVAAGVVAAAGPLSAAEADVVETDVTINMPDGMCDAAFFHPKNGSHPGVLVWTDAFGLRPSMRAIGRRISAEGYTVLVPNPFYRVAHKSPVFEDVHSFNFATDMGRIQPLMASVNAPGKSGEGRRRLHRMAGPAEAGE